VPARVVRSCATRRPGLAVAPSLAAPDGSSASRWPLPTAGSPYLRRCPPWRRASPVRLALCARRARTEQRVVAPSPAATYVPVGW